MENNIANQQPLSHPARTCYRPILNFLQPSPVTEQSYSVLLLITANIRFYSCPYVTDIFLTSLISYPLLKNMNNSVIEASFFITVVTNCNAVEFKTLYKCSTVKLPVSLSHTVVNHSTDNVRKVPRYVQLFCNQLRHYCDDIAVCTN